MSSCCAFKGNVHVTAGNDYQPRGWWEVGEVEEGES